MNRPKIYRQVSQVLSNVPLSIELKAEFPEFCLEENYLPFIRNVPEMRFYNHIIGMSSSNLNCEMKSGGTIEKYSLSSNQCTIIPARHSFTLNVDRANLCRALHLSDRLLKRNALEMWDTDKFEIVPINVVEDPLITNIHKNLSIELRKKSHGYEMYAQTIVNAMVVHILSRYSTRTKSINTYAGGLSPQNLYLVKEFISNNLDRKINLSSLAQLARLSQYHFARSFKRSFGISPHQYILQQRIKKSQQLLKQKSLTINDISISCGFSNPSHFAKCFRQQTGISPKEFRLM